jgi:hypothetical protein
LFNKLVDFLPMKEILGLPSPDLVRFVHEAITKLGPVALSTRPQFPSSIVWQVTDARYTHLQGVTLEYVTRPEHANCAPEVAFTETVQRFKNDNISGRGGADAIQTKMTEFSFCRVYASFAEADEKFALLTFGLSRCFALRLVPFAFELITHFNHRGVVLSTQALMQDEAEASAGSASRRSSSTAGGPYRR